MKKVVCLIGVLFAAIAIHVCSAYAEDYLWPVPSSKSVSQAFSTYHTGLDITGGGDVVSAKSGTVVYVYSGCNNSNSASTKPKFTKATFTPSAGSNSFWTSGYGVTTCNWGVGNGVVVRHDDGTYASYSHLSSVSVSVNTHVNQGDKIGVMGSSGNSTGVHLHFSLATGMKQSGTWCDFSGYEINNNTGSITYVDTVKVYGAEMSTGYDRTLPDGDYLIAAAGASDKSTFYYLDIHGTDRPAASDTNVSLCGPLSGDPPVYEIWTINYNPSSKFYTIKQKGTNMCLSVHRIDTLSQGTTLKVYASDNGTAQQWAITRNGNGIGYRLQPKCSGGGEHGMCLDIENGNITNGAKVRQWEINNSNAQSWLFIPYQPSQALEDGRYVLLSAVDPSKELDVPGDTGDVADKTVVHIWSDGAPSQYNSFDVKKLSNGYYTIIHHASGKALEVYGGSSSTETSVSLFTPNGSNAQQWAITGDGYDGGYLLRVKTSGYAMDLQGAATDNGSKVRQYFWNGSKAETWLFVPAEHTVSFDANGGENAPEAQIKYYKGKLVLSEGTPTRPGYGFLGWAIVPEGTVAYQAGDVYDEDADITLYAVWEKNYETVLVLPGALTEIEAEAFAGVAADAVVVPAGVTEIGEGAFGDVVLLGYPGSAAETYAEGHGLTFIPIGDDWVPEDEVPAGAAIVDEKWTYTRTTVETTTSTAASMDGWEQDGFAWQRIGGGTHLYASYPGGFDTGHSLYSKYAKAPLSGSTSGNTKRKVSGPTLASYIYWHWTFVDVVNEENRNVTVEDSRKTGVNISGSVYRDFIYFDAFETTTSLSTEGMTTSGLKSFDGIYSTYHHPEYNLPEYASWWWYRFEVYKQNYTDYEKLFTYTKTTVTQEESAEPVVEGDGVSDVRHWVRYSF